MIGLVGWGLVLCCKKEEIGDQYVVGRGWGPDLVWMLRGAWALFSSRQVTLGQQWGPALQALDGGGRKRWKRLEETVVRSTTDSSHRMLL